MNIEEGDDSIVESLHVAHSEEAENFYVFSQQNVTGELAKFVVSLGVSNTKVRVTQNNTGKQSKYPDNLTQCIEKAVGDSQLIASLPREG